jgi:para-nitrobenzyl esterase
MQRAQLAPLLFLAFFGFDAHASEPIVHTQYGDVRGVSEGQVESFKNLPFAAPPVGELRWMPPEEPEKWEGIRDASHFSSKCPQTEYKPRFVFFGNEDCLYLNVFKPSGARDLPVIVFIHGGSLIKESASRTSPNAVALYDGSRLAEGAQVVVVTLNYRLGPLGFLSHKKLSAASLYGGSGNYGFMDQIKALKWVQHNIAAFGGDPKNVTLFGQSAGGTSVWVHISSPLSKGLFHRAIVDSGAKSEAKPLRDEGERQGAEREGDKLSRLLHCSSPTTEELACLRSRPVTDIFNVNVLPASVNFGEYGAVVDNFVLTDSPIAIMRSGKHNHVPIIQGNNEEEESEFKDGVSTQINGVSTQIGDETTFAKAISERRFTDFPGASLPDLIDLYRPRRDDGLLDPDADAFRKAFNAIYADQRYICPSRRVLRALSKSQPEFFVGRFFYTHTYSDNVNFAYYGASHGFELPFIFDTLRGMEFLPTADEADLVKVFQHTWGVFAKTGVPTLSAPLPSWKRYDTDEDNYLIFDTKISTDRHLRKMQCDYWDKLPSPPDD